MKMNKLLTEWKKYINEAKRDFLEHNISKIMDSVAGIGFGENTTSDLLEQADRDQIRTFIVDNNLSNIFRTYKIQDLLGHGAVGLAFSLSSPHENYVLKLQITETTSRFTSVGVQLPTDIYGRQQTGQYDPREINVLESESRKGVPFTFGGRLSPDTTNVNLTLFVYSKVTQTAYSGKQAGGKMTTDDAYNDFQDSESETFMRALYYIQADPTNVARSMSQLGFTLSNLGMKDSKQINEIANRILQAYNGGGVRAAAGLFYKVAESKMAHFSKEQYILFCEEYFKQYSNAMKRGIPFDFHGGNFGFRPGSDTPASFDI